MTKSYDQSFRNYLSGATAELPEPPNSDSLRISFGSSLNEIKSISDEIIYHPVRYKILFGATAEPNLQARFKVVKNPNRVINDNDLKVRIVNAINEFFDVANWDFGDRFYLGELITYITNAVTPDLSNLVIVPRQPTQTFGSLFEVQSRNDEILVSGATVDDIILVQAISAAEIRVRSTDMVMPSPVSITSSSSPTSSSVSSSPSSVSSSPSSVSSSPSSVSSSPSSGSSSSGGGYY
jgi:hypothetical protein